MNTETISLVAAQTAYESASGNDLELLQSDQISYSEWNRRQREHCAQYRAVQADLA